MVLLGIELHRNDSSTNTTLKLQECIRCEDGKPTNGTEATSAKVCRS